MTELRSLVVAAKLSDSPKVCGDFHNVAEGVVVIDNDVAEAHANYLANFRQSPMAVFGTKETKAA